MRRKVRKVARREDKVSFETLEKSDLRRGSFRFGKGSKNGILEKTVSGENTQRVQNGLRNSNAFRLGGKKVSRKGCNSNFESSRGSVCVESVFSQAGGKKQTHHKFSEVERIRGVHTFSNGNHLICRWTW